MRFYGFGFFYRFPDFDRFPDFEPQIRVDRGVPREVILASPLAGAALSDHPLGRVDRIGGIEIRVSEHVPNLELYEPAYTRPLWKRILEGRMLDLREWEEGQVFLLGDSFRPEANAVLRGFRP